ncbi:hypothetical protein O6H91_15G040100 [Diphasiastrum complanatum]|uniref:Uncharacterized protein n=1 Tax=Diphasiastrum complanatum TaxID=34168 RepID=A0ACC2BHK8_DIPCM|nr:hypothetical protein O6H91_15G040100 [Diphasiastrum complanatum]
MVPLVLSAHVRAFFSCMSLPKSQVPMWALLPFRFHPTFFTSMQNTLPCITGFAPFPLSSCCIHTAPSIQLLTDQSDLAALPTQFPANKVVLKNMIYNELEDWVESMGHKKTRAMMLWRWLYGRDKWVESADEIIGIKKDFKQLLQDTGDFGALALQNIYVAKDGTRKILFGVEEGSTIETVVIPCDRGRTTVCVSSQVGCAMNCQFCYTGRMGLKKNLSTAQIVEQLVVASRLFSTELGPITNVVFMGMGEPLHNVENVIRAANIMVDLHGLHLSPNKVTISTSGLVPQLRRFCRETACSLAVSLNATTDEVRNWIMPVNRKYNLHTLMSALKEEISCKKDFKVFFEYVLLSGINDR